MNEVGERWDLILSCNVRNDLTIDFEDGNLLGTIPVIHVLSDLVKVFLDHIAPLALLHVEVDKDVLVLEFAIEELVEFTK